MRTAKDLNISTKLLSVSADDIRCLNIERICITEDNNVIVQVKERNGSFYAEPDETILKSSGYSPLYCNLKEAQEQQLKFRQEKIQEAKQQLQGAIDEYQHLIDKYFNKDLSNPFKEK